MGYVQAFILPHGEARDLQEVIRESELQFIDSRRMRELMFQMFASRATEPMRFVLLYQNYIAFTYGRNHASDLGYAEPAEWSSRSGWLYIIGYDPNDPETFAPLADTALAWCHTYPELCSPEVAGQVGH